MVTYALDRDRYLELIQADASAFADVLTASDLSPAVPSCPGWSLGDLAAHLGRVHRWSVNKITGVDTRSEAPAEPIQLRAWSADSAALLIDTLVAADPDAPTWTFIDDGTVMFWFRRQALELAIHRWDAQGARAGQGPIDANLAADGVAEVVETFYPRQVEQQKVTALSDAISFEFTDVDREPIVLGPSGRVAVEVSGPAEAVLLAVWRRIPLSSAGVTVTGDRALIDATLAGAIVP